MQQRMTGHLEQKRKQYRCCKAVLLQAQRNQHRHTCCQGGCQVPVDMSNQQVRHADMHTPSTPALLIWLLKLLPTLQVGVWPCNCWAAGVG
jgi:hypothetical protein